MLKNILAVVIGCLGNSGCSGRSGSVGESHRRTHL